MKRTNLSSHGLNWNMVERELIEGGLVVENERLVDKGVPLGTR